MSDDLPFLKDDAFTEEPQQDPAPQAQDQEPVEAKGEPTPEPAAPPAAVEEARHIPISALLDERDKRKAAMAEAEQLRRRVAEYEAKAQPPVDFFADPEAAMAVAQRTAMAAALQTKLETSRFLAEKEFGADVVGEAYAFFDANPQLSQALITSPSPFHEAVKTYQQHKAMTEIGDPVSYRARVREEARQELLSEMQAQPKPTAPPPSMAAAPGTAGAQRPSASGFDALFTKG
jgi:hypothetical protein